MGNKYYISVKITKGGKFRASIKSESFPYGTEVTIGGKKWEGADFNPFRKRVFFKCRELIDNLETQLTGNFSDDI